MQSPLRSLNYTLLMIVYERSDVFNQLFSLFDACLLN